MRIRSFITALAIFALLPAFAGAQDAPAPEAASNAAAEVVTQSAPPSAPLVPAQAASVPTPNGIVVVELFTSRGCVFCPQADVLFSALVEKSNVIGVACHISYFESRPESMVRPFCMQRQSWYMNALKAGPNYTPQMIFNGHDDVVGYRTDDVTEALQRASRENIKPLRINAGADGSFTITMPPAAGPVEGKYQLTVFLLDQTRALPGLFEPYRGQNLPFSRIADAMEVIDIDPAAMTPVRVDMTVKPGQERLVALLQNKDTGSVMAAGAYILSRNPS